MYEQLHCRPYVLGGTCCELETTCITLKHFPPRHPDPCDTCEQQPQLPRHNFHAGLHASKLCLGSHSSNFELTIAAALRTQAPRGSELTFRELLLPLG